MKIDQREISLKLNKIKTIATGKDAGEVGGVLLKDGWLLANNDEIAARTRLDTTTDETFVIPPIAIDMISKMPQGDIEIKAAPNNRITMKAAGIKNTCATIAPEAFPNALKVEQAESNDIIEAEKLIKALSSVMYAVAVTHVRPMLKGVHLRAEGGVLDVVGCDGYRLSWYRKKYEGSFAVTIPRAAAQKIIDLKPTGNITLAWDDNKIAFKTPELEITSRLISGEYLNFSQMIKRGSNQTVIDKSMFADCISRISICENDKTNCPIVANFQDDLVSFLVRNERAEYQETINLEEPIEQTIKIGFSGRFMTEALRSFDTETVSVYLGDSLSPIILEGSNLLAFLLPVRMRAGQ